MSRVPGPSYARLFNKDSGSLFVVLVRLYNIQDYRSSSFGEFVSPYPLTTSFDCRCVTYYVNVNVKVSYCVLLI